MGTSSKDRGIVLGGGGSISKNQNSSNQYSSGQNYPTYIYGIEFE